MSACVDRLNKAYLGQLLSTPECDICRQGITTTNLWLCLLPECYMLGCVNTRKLGWTTPPNTTGSTQISFPLSGLDLSPWLHTRESHTFCLIGVICHHGVSGNGGHYTCYCYNPVSDSWYHFPL